MSRIPMLILLFCLLGCGDEGVNPVQTNDLAHRTSAGTLAIPMELTTFFNQDNNQEYVGLETLTQVIGFLASQSTVHIKASRSQNGQHQSYTGTGFFVKDNWIVTAYHVIENAYAIQVATIYDNSTYSFATGSLFTDKAHDLAVFKVETLTRPALPIADSNNIFTGQWICTVGNPQGYKGIFSVGVTSGIYGGNQYIADEVLQLSIPTWHGNSGGPVLNLSGEVIGVLSGGVGNREFMSYAIPSKFLMPLINYADRLFNPPIR